MVTAFGYTMMCEQSPPGALVRDVGQAEEAGFDFSVISDHYQPWLESQGHSQYVRPEDVAKSIACGPDVERYAEAIKPYLEAGFDELAFVQIGAEHQRPFIEWAERELLPALRSLL